MTRRELERLLARLKQKGVTGEGGQLKDLGKDISALENAVEQVKAALASVYAPNLLEGGLEPEEIGKALHGLTKPIMDVHGLVEVILGKIYGKALLTIMPAYAQGFPDDLLEQTTVIALSSVRHDLAGILGLGLSDLSGDDNEAEEAPETFRIPGDMQIDRKMPGQ